MPARPLDQRIENVVSWLAAATLTAVAVIYAIRRDEGRHKQHDAFMGTTPATEPLIKRDEFRAEYRTAQPPGGGAGGGGGGKL